MQITEIHISLVKPKGGLCGFGSLVLEDQLYLSGIAIYQRLDGEGYRITYPTKKVGGKDFQLFHPIRKPLAHAIEQALIAKMNDVMSKADDVGHNRITAGC